jgi:hypothetical protein
MNTASCQALKDRLMITPCNLIAGTADGIRLLRLTENGAVQIRSAGLHGHAIRGIAVDLEDPRTFYVAAGLRGWGLHVTHDGGASFEPLGFDEYWCWDIAIDPANPKRLLLGTEPPMLWESLDAGKTWHDFPSIDNVESRKGWTFFHPPFHAGHLHGIALSSERPERILVGVEHGGLLRTVDSGQSWIDVMPGADLHRIEVHPRDPDLIFAGAGNGLFRSADGGETWLPVVPLRGRYIHGIVINPADPRRMFVYVDSHRCPVYRSQDAGENWEPAGIGLPSSRPADPMRLNSVQPSVLIYAGDRDNGSTLYVSDDEGESWSDTGVMLPKIWRLETVVPVRE